MLQRKDLIYLPSFYNDVDSGRRSLVKLAGVRQTDSGLRCQRYQKHKYNRIERSATTLYFDLMAYGNVDPTCLSVCLSKGFMDISFVSSRGGTGEGVLWKEISIKVIFREKMLINLRVVGDVEMLNGFVNVSCGRNIQKTRLKNIILSISSLPFCLCGKTLDKVLLNQWTRSEKMKVRKEICLFRGKYTENQKMWKNSPNS